MPSPNTNEWLINKLETLLLNYNINITDWKLEELADEIAALINDVSLVAYNDGYEDAKFTHNHSREVLEKKIRKQLLEACEKF